MPLMQYILISPMLFVLGMICLVMVIDLFVKQKRKRFTYWVTQATLVAGLFLTLVLYFYPTQLLFQGLVIHDQIASLLQSAIYITSILVFAISRDYLIAHDLEQGDFYLLGLFSILGMLVLVSSHHVMTVYLGIELMSLPIYAMVALYRDSEKATEASIKYFVLGAISSGLLLFGFSLLYGATHTLDLSLMMQAISTIPKADSLILILGLVFIMTGIAFKLGAVPFHMWLPDVYEGAPLATTLFITVAPKIAAFAIVYRLLFEGLPGLTLQWQQLIILLSVLSMLVGNIAAIVQTSIRRMFAYSTIAHAGYMLLGVCAATPAGFAASLFYTVVYSLMSIGSFALLTLLSQRGIEINDINDLKGLNERHPKLALVMLVVLFSMAGIPPTVGFFAKLGVLQALVYAPVNLIWLACLAIVLAVVGSYYYLRVIKVMYFDVPDDKTRIESSKGSLWSLYFIGLALVILGMLPTTLIDLIRVAVQG
jgi:NADH-quinone oxidoreductase subunit N